MFVEIHHAWPLQGAARRSGAVRRPHWHSHSCSSSSLSAGSQIKDMPGRKSQGSDPSRVFIACSGRSQPGSLFVKRCLFPSSKPLSLMVPTLVPDSFILFESLSLGSWGWGGGAAITADFTQLDHDAV